MAVWKCWKVIVEDKHGIRAIHYQECFFASAARQAEEDAGYTVLDVTEC